MSQQVGSVVIALKAVDECSSVMDKVKASTSLLASTFQSMGGTMGAVGNVMQGLASGNIAGALSAATGEIAKALKWCVSEAAESEQAMKNLSIAVEKSGAAWDSVKAGTLSALSQLQKFTVYSDEQLAAALQQLLTFGMSYDDAMKALGTTVDLAAAKQMDLGSAANLLGKAFMGNTAILARYGIDVATSKEATAAMKEAVDSVAGALKSAGADALQPFTDILGQAAVSITDSEGKMRSAKDVAQDLIGAFQSGAIDGEKFAQIMDALGVSIDTSRLAAADFPAVMSALNEQFGSTAQEQAKTYAGIQERLKNATSDLGEKIGGMVLPALAGMTEAMIPVVDWIGKGIDAYQSWTAEVLKAAPDWLKTSTYVDALGEAFSGLWKWMEDFWGFLTETFGPVLKELGDALGEVFDALSPIGEAFSEILGIFGEGTEGIDLLKGAVMAIAFEIRGFAEIIKAVAPYIKMFAEAFKAAADFIAPILVQLRDAIGGFLDWLKGAFEGFYDWLVGGSLWMDMWNALLLVASTMIGTLLGDLGTKLFEPMKNAFTGAMQWVEDSWNKGWTAVQTTFTTISTQVGTALNTKLEEMKTAVSTSTSEYAPIVTSALNGMQSAVNAGMDLIKGDWQGALDDISGALTSWGDAAKGLLDGIMGNLKGAFDAGIGSMKGTWDQFTSGVQGIADQAQDAFGQVQDAVGETAQQVQTATEPATTAVTNAFTGAFDTISKAATGLWNWLTGGSVWPDMLQTMSTQTVTRMTEVVNAFSQAFERARTSASAFAETTAAILTTFFTTVVSNFTQALAVMSQLWQTGWIQIMSTTETVCGQIMAGLASWYRTIQNVTTQSLALLTGSFQNALSGIHSLFTGTFSGMVLTAQSAMAEIVNAVSTALAQVQAAAVQMKTQMVGASIWTDMLDAMQAQTYSALGDIVGDFEAAFSDIMVTAPSLATPSYRAMTRPGELASTSPVSEPIRIDLTNTTPIIIDGAMVARVMERRLITKRQLSAWRPS